MKREIPNITIYTQAYNAQSTLPRAIESILNQRAGAYELTYYILENGSTDNTRQIVLDYAKKDKRIIPVLRDINHLAPGGTGISPYWGFIDSLCQKSDDNDCFATLDADDEYAPDFLEKTLALMEGNNLDIAACGTQYISEQTGLPMDMAYSIPSDMIISGKDFSEHFPTFCQFMWTFWNKLYRISVLRQCEFKNVNKVSYSSDTLFALEAFRRAKRVGILGGTLHKYYISEQSVSYKFTDKRVVSDRIVFNEYLTFLKAHDAMTKKNLDYIYNVHINAIRNTIIVALISQMNPLEKLEAIRDAFTHEYAQEAMRCELTPEKYKAEMQGIMFEGILPLVKSGGDAELDTAADIIAAMPHRNACVVNARRIEFSDHEILPLLLKIHAKLEGKEGQSDINALLTGLLSKYPLLANLSPMLISIFVKASSLIMQKDYANALEAFLSACDDIEIADSDAENYFLFGQHLSAAAEDTPVYIYFKKLWISYLLDCERAQEAKEELDEFLELFPEDEDFIGLKARLEGAS